MSFERGPPARPRAAPIVIVAITTIAALAASASSIVEAFARSAAAGRLLLAAACLLACLAPALAWRAAWTRHRADTRAYEALARLQVLFDCAIEAILVIGPDGAIEEVNPAARRLLGAGPADLVGRDIARVIDIAAGEGPFAVRIGLVEGKLGRRYLRGSEGRHADGRRVALDVSLAAVPLADGIRVIAMVRDASERRAAEVVRDDFVVAVSHELRTPLTSVVGALGLLRGGAGGPLPEEARRLIGIAENNARRLIRLINDIVDIDRLGAGFGAGEREPIDLGALAARAIEDARGLAEPRGVTVRLDAGGAEVPVAGDPGRLLQVIGNLLSNAIRFSPDAGVVRVALARDHRARLSVEDRGPGVPADFRGRLFTRFAQSPVGAATPGGSGLGLAISREIVRAHDGDIWLEDVAGGGARFHVALPLLASRMEASAP